jgi:membrane peptidoglycan carboxypeptidase
MLTAEEIYRTSVQELTADEQLRLAGLILVELIHHDPSFCDEWTEEDIRDLQSFVLKRLREDEDPA